MKNPAGYSDLCYGELVDCPVDPALELTDPTPDIQQLFEEFNKRYFKGRLNGVKVEWSSKMTRTVGLCTFEGMDGLACIRLSEPLLKLLPRRDLVETLLHEMIHAYLYVYKRERSTSEEEDHGPSFLKLMHRINKIAGTNVTVYHRFHEEVASCYQHWYRCDGPCGQWLPCFTSKRHKRCPPWPVDENWQRHKDICGGTFRKQRGTQGPTTRSKKATRVQQRPAPYRQPASQVQKQKQKRRRIEELSTQLMEMKLTVEGLEKEKDFYFGKLREIEVMCQENDNEQNPFIQKVLDILYATEEGFAAPDEMEGQLTNDQNEEE